MRRSLAPSHDGVDIDDPVRGVARPAGDLGQKCVRKGPVDRHPGYPRRAGMPPEAGEVAGGAGCREAFIEFTPPVVPAPIRAAGSVEPDDNRCLAYRSTSVRR